MFDDQNERNDDQSGFPFGGMFPIRIPASMVEHGREQMHNLNRERRALVNEQIQVYDELAETANMRNTQLADELVTIEVCAAGLVRNAITARVAKKIGDLLHEFDPLRAHEFTAKHYDHIAACERWEAKLGALTGSEHSHAPEVSAAPPDDR